MWRCSSGDFPLDSVDGILQLVIGRLTRQCLAIDALLKQCVGTLTALCLSVDITLQRDVGLLAGTLLTVDILLQLGFRTCSAFGLCVQLRTHGGVIEDALHLIA